MTKSEQFKVGTVIELVSMDDPQAPPCGTKGSHFEIKEEDGYDDYDCEYDD